MKILKYKKLSKNRYKIFLDNNENIILHENIIVKYNLLIKNNIDTCEIDSILKDNNYYLIYDMVLQYISIKMRCESEVINYLKNKNIDEKTIDSIVEKLKLEGYINERLYVKSFISDKIRLNNFGPNKIKNELLSLNINSDIIQEELDNYPNGEIKENLEKLIDKKIKINKTYGENILKQKIISEFLNKGYNKEDIVNILNNKNLYNKDLYDKEYKKLYNKYSKKYSGEKLEYIIKQKLYQKGFNN